MPPDPMPIITIRATVPINASTIRTREPWYLISFSAVDISLDLAGEFRTRN